VPDRRDHARLAQLRRRSGDLQRVQRLHLAVPDRRHRQLAPGRAREAYSTEAQLGWDTLPAQETIAPTTAVDVPPTSCGSPRKRARTRRPRAGALVRGAAGGQPPHRGPPRDRDRDRQLRADREGASSDIRHIVLDFGSIAFPCWKARHRHRAAGNRRARDARTSCGLYSVASPREGERPGYNNVALT
jgi:hypothetical protein